MSDLARQVLTILRMFGPCSNSEVGRRLGVAPDKTYPVISKLVEQGYAAHPKLQRWDITDKGRRWFEEQGLRPLQLFQE